MKNKKQYNKLIRDRIQELLDAAGKEYKIRKLGEKGGRAFNLLTYEPLGLWLK